MVSSRWNVSYAKRIRRRFSWKFGSSLRRRHHFFHFWHPKHSRVDQRPLDYKMPATKKSMDDVPRLFTVIKILRRKKKLSSTGHSLQSKLPPHLNCQLLVTSATTTTNKTPFKTSSRNRKKTSLSTRKTFTLSLKSLTRELRCLSLTWRQASRRKRLQLRITIHHVD